MSSVHLVFFSLSIVILAKIFFMKDVLPISSFKNFKAKPGVNKFLKNLDGITP